MWILAVCRRSPAPTLRAADVGISVDTATDIAKESADLILLEKDLMALDGGVIEGRGVFANIAKYICRKFGNWRPYNNGASCF